MKFKDPYIYSILRSEQTVFSVRDLLILWRETSSKKVYDRLRYYSQAGKLYKIKNGFYAKNKDYNKYEFASKLYSPAYIGLNTVLTMEAINFQYQSSIYVLSYLSRELEIDGQNYIFKKIKSPVLVNTKGLIQECFYYRSSKERTILDIMYLYGDFYFDNLSSIDWDKCFDLVDIYGKKSMRARLESYYQDYKEDYGN